MSEYPKEVLDALERDCGIRIRKEAKEEDTRLAYGAVCTWFGPIQEVGSQGGLPVCPHCGGVLFELSSVREWWASIDAFERTHSGYRAMWEWQRLQKKCFSTARGVGIQRLIMAYKEATGIEVKA